jgi:hypothetical protein
MCHWFPKIHKANQMALLNTCWKQGLTVSSFYPWQAPHNIEFQLLKRLSPIETEYCPGLNLIIILCNLYRESAHKPGKTFGGLPVKMTSTSACVPVMKNNIPVSQKHRIQICGGYIYMSNGI